MFKSVHTDRISQAIVDQIRDALFRKKLKVGDKLPSERQLMEQFEASRVTVREALRTLEHSGILEIKRGMDGGAFVRDPHTKFVKSFLQDMFSMGNIKTGNLTEVRLALEPFTAKVASERMKESILKQIQQNIGEARECLRQGNHRDARLLNIEFHRLIAQAAENPVIFFTMDSIMDILESNISPMPLPASSVQRTSHYHEKIFQALKGKDHHKAEEMMRKHIQQIQKSLEALDGNRADGKVSHRPVGMGE